MFLWRFWKKNGKSDGFILAAAGNGSVVKRDDFSGDSQTQTGSSGLTASGRIHPEELLE